MRKYLIGFLIVLGLFLVLVYWSLGETEDEFRTCQVLGMGDVESLDFREFDSVTLAANTLYEASWVKEFMQGEQYREAWSTPVTVPIAYLDTLKGGLTFIEEGGGKQTHSLEFKDPQGIRFTLRSLSKDPEKLVPDLARQLGLENIVIDGISAQHPYAALAVAELSETAGILHTHPQLVFIPAQESLGELNEKYGNRLYYLEYESEGPVDWTGIPGAIELIDTEDLQELKLELKDSLRLDREALLRARLFDLIIGDWDRHAKQWGWVLLKGPEGYRATPVPTDRDNAFFDQDGILPNLIANRISLPEVQSFTSDIRYLPGLVQEFDAYFLGRASLEEFKEAAGYLQSRLSDAAIDGAFAVWPPAVDSLDGPQIRSRLKSRRDSIMQYAERFHEVLGDLPSKPIRLSGSEELELPEGPDRCFECDSVPHPGS